MQGSCACGGVNARARVLSVLHSVLVAFEILLEIHQDPSGVHASLSFFNLLNIKARQFACACITSVAMPVSVRAAGWWAECCAAYRQHTHQQAAKAPLSTRAAVGPLCRAADVPQPSSCCSMPGCAGAAAGQHSSSKGRSSRSSGAARGTTQ